MPKLSADDAWGRLVVARSAVLATIDADGAPDLVPITFVARRPVVWFAVDDVKPKSTLMLGRLVNIGRDPRVAILFDDYDDADWSRLWWVRAKGVATVVTGRPEAEGVLDALAGKHPPYAARRPPGEVVRIDVDRVLGWSAC